MNFFKKNKIEPTTASDVNSNVAVSEPLEEAQVTDEPKEAEPKVKKRKAMKERKLIGRFAEDVDQDESLNQSKNIEGRLSDSKLSKDVKDKQAIQKVIFETFLKDILYMEDENGELVPNPDVTDVRFNGTQLRIQDNKKGRYIYTDEEITPEHIAYIGRQVEIATNSRWNTTQAILDADIAHFRFNFMNSAVSPYGHTMAIRAANSGALRTKLTDVCEVPMAQLFELIMEAGLSLMISGMTGSGKTQMQKMITGYIPNDKIIYLIEDTMDSGIKELYPDKDITSLQILKRDQDPIGFTKLMHSGLRNNPDWLMISEVRGEETNDLIGAGLTGHSFCSTIHTEGAGDIPNRMSQEITRAFANVDKASVSQDIAKTLKIGTHMHLTTNPDGSLARAVRETVEFTGVSPEVGVTHNVLYRKGLDYDEETQEYVEVIQYGKISDVLKQKFKDARVYHKIPKEFL